MYDDLSVNITRPSHGGHTIQLLIVLTTNVVDRS